MLVINVPMVEGFDNSTQKFVETEFFQLELEHSLASLSKWEMKYEKPFLTSEDKNAEETAYYIKCMAMTPDVPAEVWSKITKKNLEDINEYIAAKMTATWFSEDKKSPPSREIITNELMYYWMVALQIPWEAQHWHLNRFLTLVKVCNVKNQPPKKMSRRELAQRHREINEQRRAQYGSNG